MIHYIIDAACEFIIGGCAGLVIGHIYSLKRYPEIFE